MIRAGGLVVGVEEEIDEQVLDRRPIVADAAIAMRALGRVLEPVERALARERRQPWALRLEPSEHGAEHRVAAQVVMVDQVLVAERDGEHALADQRRQRVAAGRIAAVGEAGGEAVDEPDRPISS